MHPARPSVRSKLARFQLYCFSDPIFRAALDLPPEQDPKQAVLYFAKIFSDPSLTCAARDSERVRAPGRDGAKPFALTKPTTIIRSQSQAESSAAGRRLIFV